MKTRWVAFRVDERLHEEIRAAAEADHRSISSWVALTVERAIANAGGATGQHQS